MDAVAVMAAASASSGQIVYWPVWLLFLLAGLLVGGAWSAYTNGSKKLTIAVALTAALATALAIAMLATAGHW